MTRLNLTQACLLEASGELGEKARAHLERYVQKYPAAYLEREIVRGQLAALRALPQAQLTEDEQRKLASAIKQGVQRKLRQQERTDAAQVRSRLVYRCLAGVSGLAACLVIAAGLWAVQRQHDRTIARAEQRIRDYIDADRANLTDVSYNAMESQIDSLEEHQRQLLATEHGSSAMITILDAIDNGADSHLPPMDEGGAL